MLKEFKNISIIEFWMKTPIERVTEYINDRDTENRNPITMLKELRARILQDKIIAQKTYIDGMNDAIKICETSFKALKEFYKQRG